MKKSVLLFFVSIVVASCLGSSTYSDSYTEFATFEYANDYKEMFGTDSLYFEPEYKIGFTWTYYLAFGHKIDQESNEFEGGFLLSYLSVPESENTELLDNNEYRANQIYIPPKKNTYVVFSKTESMPEKHFWFTFVPTGEITGSCTPNSVCVNNTVEVINSLKENFVDGDAMIFKSTGYLEGEQTGDAEIKLAEFTSAKDSIITSWTSFDLSALGKVDQINFDFVLPEGSTVPTTVCMDDFIAALSFNSK